MDESFKIDCPCDEIIDLLHEDNYHGIIQQAMYFSRLHGSYKVSFVRLSDQRANCSTIRYVLSEPAQVYVEVLITPEHPELVVIVHKYTADELRKLQFPSEENRPALRMGEGFDVEREHYEPGDAISISETADTGAEETDSDS